MSKETQSIFTQKNKQEPSLSVSYHNAGELIPDSTDETKEAYNSHYGLRSGANNYGSESMGIVLKNPDKKAGSQAEYLGSLYRKDFRVYSFHEMEEYTANLASNEPKPLAVPYINNEQTVRRIHSSGMETWGLPPEVINTLKNKTTFHELVTDAQIEGFEVPEYRISEGEKSDFVRKAAELVSEANDMYKKHGLGEKYPLGLVMRLEESSGGQGMAIIRQRKDGSITVSTETQTKPKIVGPGKSAWEKAIDLSHSELYDTVQEGKKPSVVISRYIDIEDSPGLSMLFIDGTAHSLGLNGQLQNEESAACVGTSSYEPHTKYLKDMKKQIEGQSAQAFAKFMKKTADNAGIPFETIRAIANVDIMIPGKMENKLRDRQGKRQALYIAECNTRWTNYTDAVMAGVGANGREPTVSDMRTTIEEGIFTKDKEELRGARPEDVRDILQTNDARTKDARVIVRMPVAPMGVILLGNKQMAEAELQKAISEAKKIAKNRKSK
jgi:hypothetical protein